jgi:hypothetical protein
MAIGPPCSSPGLSPGVEVSCRVCDYPEEIEADVEVAKVCASRKFASAKFSGNEEYSAPKIVYIDFSPP